MKKLLLFLIIILPLISFAQSSLSQGYPTFYGGSTSVSPDDKLKLIRNETQAFISENVDSEFIEKYFKINDSIEFDLSYVVNLKGIVTENNIAVYTDVDFFNNKIISVLKSLPKFTPAIADYDKKPYDFQIDFKLEFIVNSEFRFVPIERVNFHSAEFSISPKEKQYLKLAKEYLGPTFRAGIVDVILYVSTNEYNELTNIRAYSIDPLFSNRVIDEFKANKLKFQQKGIRLNKNTNYIIPVSLRLFKDQKYYNEYINTGVLRVAF